MGFLKKITRPISKVLDKIVPNEIKPALPFLSAAAPFLLPAGIAGGSGISALLRRGALTGGINIASQLAQEGSEGDFSGLSALLAAGTGALTAPGASSTLEQFRSPVGEFDPARTFLQKGKDMGITGLQKASEFLTTSGETLRSPGFNKATAEAALLPVTQGTMDLGIAEARRAAKDFADEALASLPEGASDADRALAIRQFMEAAGYFSEDEIVETISAAGYANGGRVGFQGGGMDAGQMYITEPGIMGNPAVMEKIENMREFMIANPDIEDITDYSEKYESKDPDFEGIEGAIEEVNEKNTREFQNKYIQAAIKLASDKNIGIGDAMMITSDEDFDIDNMKYKGSSKGILEILNQKAYGGRVGAEEGGLMNLGGREMDMRGGGFIPIGKKERADDVPARLSKNEFVMTADAVRAAGGGSVNKGAKRMYDLMNNLEARV